MKSRDDIEQAIRELPVANGRAADMRILSDARTALERGMRESGGRSRGIMGMPWPLALSRVAAALFVLVPVGVMVAMALNRPPARVYAVEDTIEANRGLRGFHIRLEPAGGGIGEAWALFDQQGKLERLRMNFPATEDGPKDVLWRAGKAEVYFHAKKSFVAVPEADITRGIPDVMAMFDPRVAMEKIAAAVASGKINLEIRRPAAAGDPITLVVGAAGKNGEETVIVDPSTKLVRSIERRRTRPNGETVSQRQDYLEYNEVDNAAFNLDVPKETIRIDQTGTDVGREKGALGDAEITALIGKEFFEALERKDYEKAGQLFDGMPAEKMREIFGKIEVLRVIEVGKPSAQPIPGVGGMVVPVTVEVRMDGETKTQTFNPAIRPVYNQPGRWTIHGGI